MKVLVFFVSLFAVSMGEHLIVWNRNDLNYLIHHSSVNYNGIPFMQRVKQWFYSGPTKINSIMVYDNLHTKGKVSVTAGGIGHTYVNLSFRSERGQEIDYDIGLYT